MPNKYDQKATLLLKWKYNHPSIPRNKCPLDIAHSRDATHNTSRSLNYKSHITAFCGVGRVTWPGSRCNALFLSASPSTAHGITYALHRGSRFFRSNQSSRGDERETLSPRERERGKIYMYTAQTSCALARAPLCLHRACIYRSRSRVYIYRVYKKELGRRDRKREGVGTGRPYHNKTACARACI